MVPVIRNRPTKNWTSRTVVGSKIQLGCPHAVGDLSSLHQHHWHGTKCKAVDCDLPVLLGLDGIELAILRGDEVDVTVCV